MCADAPDTSGQQQAALMQAKLSEEQLAWAKEIYKEEAPARAEAAARNREVSDAALASMRQNDAVAKDYYDYQTGTFRPLEQQIVAASQEYDTPERRAAEAEAAGADVQMQVDAQRAATLREMQRSGVNPSSGKVMALQGSMDLGAAKAKAGASNQAVRNVEQQGYARRMDAANLGRGLASSQATSANIALNAGNSAAGSANSGLAALQSGTGTVMQGYAGAQSGLAGAANTYGSIAQQQAAAGGSGGALFGALGNVAGQFVGSKAGSSAIASLFSDKNMKEDVEPASDEAALDAVAGTPVALWKYREDSPAADGGKQHIGPMAQDLRETAGEAVAPGGTRIDPVNSNGLLMSAVRGLNKKVDNLAAQLGGNLKAA